MALTVAIPRADVAAVRTATQGPEDSRLKSRRCISVPSARNRSGSPSSDLVSI